MQTIHDAKPMELWATDIMGPLPVTARGNQYVLVISDHFMKWVETIPMANHCADTVARAFVDQSFITRHGIPDRILTDQGRNFESNLMRKVMQLLDVKKVRTSPYHPQTDRQVERFNRTLKGIMTSYVNDEPQRLGHSSTTRVVRLSDEHTQIIERFTFQSCLWS